MWFHCANLNNFMSPSLGTVVYSLIPNVSEMSIHCGKGAHCVRRLDPRKNSAEHKNLEHTIGSHDLFPSLLLLSNLSLVFPFFSLFSFYSFYSIFFFFLLFFFFVSFFHVSFLAQLIPFPLYLPVHSFSFPFFPFLSFPFLSFRFLVSVTPSVITHVHI